MKTRLDLNRRQFLQTAAVAASGLSLATAPAAESASRSPGKPKIGCLSWCFHDLSPAADPEPALDIIGELGFDGVELIVTARRDLKDFWTDAKIDRLNQKLQRNKLRVSQFVIFQPVVEDLSSTEPAAREQALDYFEAGCRIGKKLERADDQHRGALGPRVERTDGVSAPLLRDREPQARARNTTSTSPKDSTGIASGTPTWRPPRPAWRGPRPTA